MGSDLQALADRLEGLSGADRDMDVAIEIWANPILKDLPRDAAGWSHPEYGRIRPAQPYTSSLDAVVALVERVLKPLSLQVTILSNGSTSAVLGTSASPFQFVALAPTAPLALLRALVAAKIEEVGNE